jgi:hypothetical protein
MPALVRPSETSQRPLSPRIRGPRAARFALVSGIGFLIAYLYVATSSPIYRSWLSPGLPP